MSSATNRPGDLTLHARGDEHRSRLGQRLHARGDIGRFAEHFAGRIDHHRPALEADAGGKLRRALAGVPGVELGKRALDRERRAHRAFGVVLLRVRIAEQRHQPVAELLQHMAAKPGHRRRGFVEIGVDEVAPVLGVELRREARRADEIAEHDRDRAALGGSSMEQDLSAAQSCPPRLDSAIALSRRLRCPRSTPSFSRSPSRQFRQDFRVDLVVPKCGLVLAESEAS